ncbi:hypothetical protein [Neobacillus sp. FSL H8-0543]|uniref:hypothetical protein n=1 Tax=Neobacillus sp. FSL H8-0543 TaxID=2954672 RepID=UPI0031587CB1
MENLFAAETQDAQEEVKKFDFGKFMFGELGLRRRKDLKPNDMESDNTLEESPSTTQNISKPQNLRRKNTVSGNFIISRYWDDNNMWEFRVRRKTS